MRKKCPQCRIVFHNADRLRCLYCDTVLATVSDDDPLEDMVAFLAKDDDPVVLSNDAKPLERVVEQKNILSASQDQADKAIGHYFRTRPFAFFYRLSRNELKMGQQYKRFLIQPFDRYFILMLPWVVINLLDSLFFHWKYKFYCPVCKWKYTGPAGRHDPKECAYNREYTLVINAILSGFIGRLEPTFAGQAALEAKRGQRSAYVDLCVRQSPYDKVLDHVSMFFSGAVIFLGLFALLEPIIKELIIFLGIYEPVEITN